MTSSLGLFFWGKAVDLAGFRNPGVVAMSPGRGSNHGPTYLHSILYNGVVVSRGNTVVRPPIGRVGGKARLAPWIASFFTSQGWKNYVEPFAGSAAVFFQLCDVGAMSGRLAVLNDRDRRIINLYRVIRSHSEILGMLVKATPYSRAEFQESKRYNKDGPHSLDTLASQIEDARQYLIQNRQSFSNSEDGGWSYSANSDRNRPTEWVTLSDRLSDAARAFSQLTGCMIECRDAISIIKTWGTSLAAIYADPPYIGCEGYYAVCQGQQADDLTQLHFDLAAALNASSSPIIAVSYYDDPTLDDLYPESDGWERHYKDVAQRCSNSTYSKSGDRRQELLLVRRDVKPLSSKQLKLF